MRPFSTMTAVARLSVPMVAGALLAVSFLASHVSADPAADLKPALGATIVSTHPDGRKARLSLNRDGTFTAEGRAGNRSSGVWKLKGDRLCLTQRKPMAIPLSYCHAFPHEAVGKPWPDIAVNGDHVVNEIVPR